MQNVYAYSKTSEREKITTDSLQAWQLEQVYMPFLV